MEECFTYDRLYYIHPDHLGSWTTVTNRNGLVMQDVRFDPWGTPYYSDSTTLTQATSLLFDRGFTGHEHMMAFGLINMNGRVYDPMTSSFLSVDNYVQDPSSTQNFNRYAYCLNNPLKYVDPSGDFLTWCFNHLGFSLGINLTPLGIPIGFGINVSWANGGSVGVYGEVAYRAGGTGLGFGAGFQQSLDYSFKYNSLSTTSSANAYYSFGCVTVGGSVSYNYNMTYAQGNFGWNVGVGAAWNPNMPYSPIGQNMGFGLGISYGSGGLNYCFNGYYQYQGLTLQDKLDIIVDKHKSALENIGNGDASYLVGDRHNLSMEDGLYSEFGNIVCEGEYANGVSVRGTLNIDYSSPEKSYYTNNKIYISKNRIRQMWRGNKMAIETLYHEQFHCVDYRNGTYNKLVSEFGAATASNILEYRAYMFNFYRTFNSYYYNRALYYGFDNKAFYNVFMIRNGGL